MKSSFLISVGLLCFVLLGAGLLFFSPTSQPQEPVRSVAPKEYIIVCRLAGDNPQALCAAPSLPCQKLRNTKTTEIALDESFMTLHVDGTATLLQLEQQADWIKVRVLEPSWLSESHVGWLPASKLACRKVEKTETF